MGLEVKREDLVDGQNKKLMLFHERPHSLVERCALGFHSRQIGSRELASFFHVPMDVLIQLGGIGFEDIAELCLNGPVAPPDKTFVAIGTIWLGFIDDAA